mmetsp:Transcript_4076/g.7848  ORF Transcript_4076/g.7848 Transcript_4076/m.7848 type:complete len:245 (+) Transcript_4076:543-1277(+)
MLEGAAAVALRVDVGAFFELEGTLVGHRFAEAFAQNETVFFVQQPFGNVFALVPHLDGHSERYGEAHQGIFQRLRAGRGAAPRQFVLLLFEPQGDQRQRGHLRGERLGGGDGVFSSSVQIDAQLGHPGDLAAHGVDHAETGHPAVLRRLHDPGDVLGLSRLRDHQQAGLSYVGGKVLGLGLGGVDGVHGVEGLDLLHDLFGVFGGVEAGAAGAEGEVFYFRQGLLVLVQSAETDAVGGDAAAET